MTWKLVPAVLLATLTACASGPQSAPRTGSDDQGSSSPSTSGSYPGSGGECNAEPIQNLVGQPYTDSVSDRARGEAGAASVRVLRPGQVMTMEYDPRRLNIILDDKNAIEALRCG